MRLKRSVLGSQALVTAGPAVARRSAKRRHSERNSAVLRARRRILLEPPQWALTPSGLNALIGRPAVSEPEGQGAQRAQEEEVDDPFDEEGFASYENADDGSLAGHLAGLEAISQRTKSLLSELAARPPESRDPMVYDLDWDENARMGSWREAVGSTQNMPSLLAAAIALLAWEEIDPLQHKAWLGRLLVGAILRGSPSRRLRGGGEAGDKRA